MRRNISHTTANEKSISVERFEYMQRKTHKQGEKRIIMQKNHVESPVFLFFVNSKTWKICLFERKLNTNIDNLTVAYPQKTPVRKENHGIGRAVETSIMRLLHPRSLFYEITRPPLYLFIYLAHILPDDAQGHQDRSSRWTTRKPEGKSIPEWYLPSTYTTIP